MKPLTFLRIFINFFLILIATQVISKVLFGDYTNEQLGESLRSHAPYTGVLIGSLIFTIGMYFVAKRGQKKEA